MMTRRYIPVALVLFAIVLAGCQTLQGRSAGRVVDDAGITAGVKAKLVAEEPKALTRVNVDTVNGVVYLTGIVGTSEMRQRASTLARQQEGVVRIVNNLQIEGAPAAAPRTR